MIPPIAGQVANPGVWLPRCPDRTHAYLRDLAKPASCVFASRGPVLSDSTQTVSDRSGLADRHAVSTAAVVRE